MAITSIAITPNSVRAMPELNYMYAPTREAVVAMANHWCELGVDGFRMDAVKHIFLKMRPRWRAAIPSWPILGSGIDYSSNVTKNLAFWKYLNSAVKAKHPNAFFVGENFDGHAYHVAPTIRASIRLFDFYSYFNLTSAAACGLE
jgi:alpha-amylase